MLKQLKLNRTVAIAPMMACTDRHFRYLTRLLCKKILLYTEMVHSRAILHGDRNYLLAYSAPEHPIALQVGGCDASELAQCARIAVDYGFDEINLNVGCPSERVQSGQFGACLFKQPDYVADAVHAMKSAANISVTVKTRIAVDDHDQYHHLYYFVDRVFKAGCEVFIIHARKAWLKGLNPKQNREIPPLNYPIVYQLKQDFPKLQIIIKGGIKTTLDIHQHLNHVDGVMIGREAYSNPYLLATFDQEFYGEVSENDNYSRAEIVLKYMEYATCELQKKVPLRALIKPIIGLFQGQAGAKGWRRYLNDHAQTEDARILETALTKMF